MVDFFANWCGPCQMMGPVIANLAEEYAGKIKIGKINVDENPGVAQAYEVATIPNLVFFKDGKVVNRVIGVVPDNVLKEKLNSGSELDDILVDAFAVAREAAWRQIHLKAFKVQLMGGIALH